ncbi:vitamin K epoxide reductase complex subunit 1 [Pseudomyrmex gracilis]|uniref:vitamin K epoxide reductase complex subunit 1 n=1 Tax=Pseudomyrmex gracilis TaxID=219809 RepID=UPI000995D7DD|nr:vitamin K epoxide reductase complex subunit 1 [Pseudomyrmex gracilis]
MPAAQDSVIRKLNAGLVTACVIGLVLSYYAYLVETKREHDSSYEPMCDISEHISCTKVFMSEYGKGFGLMPKNSMFNVPNSIYGLLFYTQMSIFSMINDYAFSGVVVALGLLSNIGSIYLAYLLYMFNDICVVCISTYVVNAAITYLAIKKFRILHVSTKNKKKMK